MYTANSCKIYLCRGNHSYLYFPHNIVSVMYVFFLCYRKVDGIDYTAKVGRVPVSQGAKISWQTLYRKTDARKSSSKVRPGTDMTTPHKKVRPRVGWKLCLDGHVDVVKDM